MPLESSNMLGRAHDNSKAFEWIKLVLSLFVIPLVITVIDLRESKALQAAEITNLQKAIAQIRRESQIHADHESGRIEKVDAAQREVENNLTKVVTMLDNAGKQIDEALKLVRGRR